MNAVMPTMLAWVLGGNDSALRSADRQPHCRLDDKPKTFDEKVSLCIWALQCDAIHSAMQKTAPPVLSRQMGGVHSPLRYVHRLQQVSVVLWYKGV